VKPETREWWGKLNAVHVGSGIAGIWNDMNEPATGPIDPHPMRFDRDGANFPHDRYHNQYGMLMAMGTHQGLLAARPNERTFILSRAGFAGIQRFSANWMGDNCSRWTHLHGSVPMAMGLGLSGQPFIGADVGGFMENTEPELLVRWTQTGAFIPFFRNHNCKDHVDQYPWSFGPSVESLCREAIQQRYRLIPYLQAACMEAAATGRPIVCPLVLDHQSDAFARMVDDAYLFGRALLVAPITRDGQSSRHAYLPAGDWWRAGADGSPPVAGPALVTANAPINTIPVFWRCGMIVPHWPEAPRSTMGYYPERIELHLALPVSGGQWSSRLHEDDGLTFGFARGQHLVTAFLVKRQDRDGLVIEATVEGSGFAEFRRREFSLHFHAGSPTAVEVDGKRLPQNPETGGYHFANKGEPFRAIVRSRPETT
jgi:alpha-glucosidase